MNSEPAEFGHVDRKDAFQRRSNLVWCFIRTLGISFFFLMIGSVPLGMAALILSQMFGVGEQLSSETREFLTGVAVVGWLGLSLPIAILWTWVRWQRLRFNRVVVGADGFEILWYPRASRAYPWSSVRSVRYSAADDDKDEELFLDTDQGRVKLNSEHWPTGEIRQAVAKYAKVTEI